MEEQNDALSSFIRKVAEDPALQAKLESEDSDPIAIAKEIGINLEAKALQIVFKEDDAEERELNVNELTSVSGGFGFKLSGKSFLSKINLTTKTISKFGTKSNNITDVTGCGGPFPTQQPGCSSSGFNPMTNISQ